MSEITLRLCDEADLSAIREIYAHTVLHGTASFERDVPTLYEMSARRDRLIAGGHPYVVAVQAGRVVGYAYAGPFRQRIAYENTVESSIYIAPDCTGRGLGKILLTAIVDGAEAAGFRQMVAIIADSDAKEASIALHAALGFEKVGHLTGVGRKHDTWLDIVMMQRSLGPGRTTPPSREGRAS